MSRLAVSTGGCAVWDSHRERDPDWHPDPGRVAGEVFARESSDDQLFLGALRTLSSGAQDMPVDVSYEGEAVLPRWLLASVVFTAATPTAPDVATTEETFAALANRWHDETDLLSSPARITSSHSYLRIIAMGRRAIPMILEDLRERGGLWYQTLRVLSEEDPVPTEDRGDIGRMKEAWIQWGRDRGYIRQ